jgi:hypothetical protein
MRSAFAPADCPVVLPIPVSGKPCNYNPRLLGGGAMVPYIGSWTEEQRCALQLAWRGNRSDRLWIGYVDETPFDRDERGVLWQRHTARIGKGRPLFAVVHPLRQRRVMSRLLCQVCGQAADHTERGSLWLLPAQETVSFDGENGLMTRHPPLCLPCARMSVQVCPGMKSGYMALRAHSTVYGVVGTIPAGETGTVDGKDVEHTGDTVPFDHPAIAQTQAHQLIRMLTNISVVNLDTLS